MALFRYSHAKNLLFCMFFKCKHDYRKDFDVGTCFLRISRCFLIQPVPKEKFSGYEPNFEVLKDHTLIMTYFPMLSLLAIERVVLWSTCKDTEFLSSSKFEASWLPCCRSTWGLWGYLLVTSWSYSRTSCVLPHDRLSECVVSPHPVLVVWWLQFLTW